MNAVTHKTHFEFVAKINGRAQYVENLTELDDDTLIAKVKVITNNGTEVSRDQFVPDENWITVKEYYESL